MSTRSFHKLIFISFFIQISAISCIVSIKKIVFTDTQPVKFGSLIKLNS